VQGELAVFGHTRSYGTYDLVIAAPMAQVGARYGESSSVGPILRVDALERGTHLALRATRYQVTAEVGRRF
jgi:hypothetical protein